MCRRIEPVALPWELTVVQHRTELVKPSNTARLLAAAVSNSRFLVHAVQDRPLTALECTDVERDCYVVYPSPDAETVCKDRLQELAQRPTRLIVVDGTWRQTSRMVRRLPGVGDLPRLQLPLGEPSRWTIRRAHEPGFLCTFETVLRIASLAEHTPSATALEETYQRFLDAQIAGRAGGQARVWED